MISRSVAQIATASMRTSTSARFGTGTGLSVSVSCPGSPSTQAFMVSGTGKSGLVFTPEAARIELSYVRCIGAMYPRPSLAATGSSSGQPGVFGS